MILDYKFSDLLSDQTITPRPALHCLQMRTACSAQVSIHGSICITPNGALPKPRRWDLGAEAHIAVVLIEEELGP